jgi:hypothetical protein
MCPALLETGALFGSRMPDRRRPGPLLPVGIDRLRTISQRFFGPHFAVQ